MEMGMHVVHISRLLAARSSEEEQSGPPKESRECSSKSEGVPMAMFWPNPAARWSSPGAIVSKAGMPSRP